MKARFLLAVLTMATLTWNLSIQAQDTKKNSTEEKLKRDVEQFHAELLLQQQIQARQFAEFTQGLLKIKTRLERSPRQEDRDKAMIIDKALEFANQKGLTVHFDQIVETLKNREFKNLPDVQKAMERTKSISDDLRSMLAMLREDSRLQALKQNERELKELLEKIDKVIHEQKVLEARTQEGSKADPKDLKANQDKIQDKTAEIAKAMDGKGAKAQDLKGGSKGSGKNGDQSSQSKDGGKDQRAESKGDDKESKPGDKGAAKGDQSAQGGEKSGDKSAQGGEKSGDKSAQGGEKSGDKSAQGGEKSGDKSAQGGEKSGDKSPQGSAKSGEKAGDMGTPKGSKAGDGQASSKDNKGGEGKEGGAKSGGKEDGAKASGAKSGEKSGGEKSGDKSAQGGEKSGGEKSGDKSAQGGEKSGGEKSGGEKSGDKSAKGGKSGGKGGSGEAKSGGGKGGMGDGKGPETANKDSKNSGSAKSKSGGAGQGKTKQGNDKDGQSQAKAGPKAGGAGGGSPSAQQPSQKGDPQSGGGDPQQQQSQQQQQIANNKKKIEEAGYDMHKAGEDISKAKNGPAQKHQADAIQKLEEVKKKLEQLLNQIREEEMERLLAALINRCEKMLAMQIEVRDGTLSVSQLIEKNADKKATRDQQQNSIKLGDRESEIVVEADKAIDLLKGEGSAVAFPEVFQQVREDMINVQRRLTGTDVGPITVGIENDIIASLEEMIKALKKQKQEMEQKKSQGGGGGGGPPPDQKLLDQIAELKMIRAMQIRVNSRTTDYGKAYNGEQANDPTIRRELGNLGDRQERIFDITRKIAQGDNR